MNRKNLTEQILETIKKKRIKPRPRWEFLLKDYSIWLAGIISLLVGSLAFSVIIHMFKNNDWNLYKYISDGFLSFVLVTLPYFWVIFLAIFILLVYYNFKNTKGGYKYKLPVVILASVIISIVLGTLLYDIGIGQTIDEILSEQISFYNRFINPRRAMWVRPEEGLLAGMVVSVTDSEHFEVQDINGKVWEIDATQAITATEAEINVSGRIKIIGEKINDNTFQAKIIVAGPPPRRWLKPHHLFPGRIPGMDFERKILPMRMER